MKATTRSGVVLMTLALTLPACGGGDDDRRVEAAKWCEITDNIKQRVEFGDPVIDYDLADEWIDAAPEDIRPATERAARTRRELPPPKPPRALVEAETEISAYARDNCPK